MTSRGPACWSTWSETVVLRTCGPSRQSALQRAFNFAFLLLADSHRRNSCSGPRPSGTARLDPTATEGAIDIRLRGGQGALRIRALRLRGQRQALGVDHIEPARLAAVVAQARELGRALQGLCARHGALRADARLAVGAQRIARFLEGAGHPVAVVELGLQLAGLGRVVACGHTCP